MSRLALPHGFDPAGAKRHLPLGRIRDVGEILLGVVILCTPALAAVVVQVNTGDHPEAVSAAPSERTAGLIFFGRRPYLEVEELPVSSVPPEAATGSASTPLPSPTSPAATRRPSAPRRSGSQAGGSDMTGSAAGRSGGGGSGAGGSARSSFALHVPVLMYHRIVPASEAGGSLPGLVVSPQLFGAQLDALRSAGWHTITLGTLANDLLQGVRPAPRTFVITFDDGWPDGYTYAFPRLKSHAFVATYFIIPGRIGTSYELSVAQLIALAGAGNEIANHTMDHVNLANVSGSRLDYEICTASARIAAVIGRRPVTLAYPFGGFDTAAVNAVSRCSGLAIAVTTQTGARETIANRFTVPRIRVGPGTSAAALVATLNAYR